MPPPPPDPKVKAPPPPARQPNVPETAVFKITVPADAPLGVADVRFVGKWGVSNPRAFVVGDLPEVMEKEPNNDVPEAQRVDLNTTVNGTIANAVDVDYFVFAGKKGQRVLVSCLASTIDSRLLPDVQVYDAKNRMVGSGRNYSGNDALADCASPTTAITTSVSASSRTRPTSPAAPPNTFTASRCPPIPGLTRFSRRSSSRASRRR